MTNPVRDWSVIDRGPNVGPHTSGPWLVFRAVNSVPVASRPAIDSDIRAIVAGRIVADVFRSPRVLDATGKIVVVADR